MRVELANLGQDRELACNLGVEIDGSLLEEFAGCVANEHGFHGASGLFAVVELLKIGLGHQHTNGAAIEDERTFFDLMLHIDRNRHGTDLCEGERNGEILGRVVELHGDVFALFDAELEEIVRRAVDQRIELCVSKTRNGTVAVFEHQKLSIAFVADKPVPKVADILISHDAAHASARSFPLLYTRSPIARAPRCVAA